MFVEVNGRFLDNLPIWIINTVISSDGDLPMKKQGVSRRIGFKKKPQVKEWSVVGDRIVWKESLQTSIKLKDISHSRPDPVRPLEEDERLWVKTFQFKCRNRHLFDAEERWHLMLASYYFSPKSFIRLAKDLLSSKKWTDAEKICFLINKLPSMSGQIFGVELQKILSAIYWSDRSFKQRMSIFYDSTEIYGSEMIDYEEKVQADRAAVSCFGDRVTLFRGFIVPSDKSVRESKTNAWMRQASGQSIYYTTDIAIAKRFAVIQKYNFLMMAVGMPDDSINPELRSLVEGKIAIAKYSVKTDDIILFDDALGRNEKECICLPIRTDLLNYEFLGFNDFIEVTNSVGSSETPLNSIAI